MRVHVQCKHVHVGVMYVECVFSEIVFCICVFIILYVCICVFIILYVCIILYVLHLCFHYFVCMHVFSSFCMYAFVQKLMQLNVFGSQVRILAHFLKQRKTEKIWNV